jgi:light-regulated signal transduction histidine kinase (bacteriophytochrome)
LDESELLRRELARERAARKQAEDLLEQKSLELYGRNRQLETEIAERRRIEQELRRYANELSRANEELEQFAYVASHDLKAPLRGIASFSQLLERRAGDKLDAECREYLQFIGEGTERLHAVINDLLAYSRSGRVELQRSAVALESLLDQALAELGPAISASGAAIAREPLPVVQGDATLLAQVIRNLIDNAIKYVPAGQSPRVTIRAGRADEGWVLRVCDQGLGIAEAHRERIFQMFQRLHTADEYPGTGMGLAICRKVAERHGGRLWVECPATGGSEFCLYLPAAAGEGAAPAT